MARADAPPPGFLNKRLEPRLEWPAPPQAYSNYYSAQSVRIREVKA